MSQQPGEGITIDWSTAPAQMREAFEANAKRVKELEERDKANAGRLLLIDRAERVNALKAELGDVAKDLTAEDFADMAPDAITPTIVQARALERQAARAAATLQVAKDLGYETVEQYELDRKALADKRAADLKAMTGNAATAGAGSAPPEAPKPPGEDAIAAFREARQAGKPSDEAENAFIGTLFQRQIEALEAAPQ
jgi:hypothetical protein